MGNEGEDNTGPQPNSQLNPWDRRENESSLAYERFRFFLFMGPTRSIKSAHAEFQSTHDETATIRTWTQLSSDNDWTPRAKAFDMSMYKREEDLLITRSSEWRMRRYEILGRGWDVVDKALQELVEDIESGDRGLSMKDLKWLTDLLMKESRMEFEEKPKDGPQVLIDARQQTIKRIEITKDYGRPLLEGEVIDAA